MNNLQGKEISKRVKKEVDIFDEENTIILDDEFSIDTFHIFPSEKKFKINSSVKDDVFYSETVVEYKISDDPIELTMRTVERSNEPPKEYSIKDGVVLESEINEAHFVFPDRIKNLKKQVVWSKIPILGNYEVNLYILSKHPEIISKDKYRKLLRQSIERIKMGVSKVRKAVERDEHGLQIHTDNYEMIIWYPFNELEEEENKMYWDLPEEKRIQSTYGKKIKHAETFKALLFDEASSDYIGITENEFKSSDQIVEYMQKLLDNKEEPVKKEASPAISKTKGIIISIILTFLLSWIVSWFVDINAFLIFIIVQVITFAQSFVGSFLERTLDK